MMYSNPAHFEYNETNAYLIMHSKITEDIKSSFIISRIYLIKSSNKDFLRNFS